MSDNFRCVTRITVLCKSSGATLEAMERVLRTFGFLVAAELALADRMLKWVDAKAGERDGPRDQIIQIMRLLSGVGAPMSTTNLAPDQVEVITYDDLSFKVVRVGDEYTVTVDLGALASSAGKSLLLEVWEKSGVSFVCEMIEEKPT